MKLTIELVPKTSWYSNVRSNVSKEQWDKIRKKSYSLANHKCELCGDVGTNQGYKHKVEAHEIWHYDDINKIQKLTGIISLCPFCHKSKHVGLAQINNEEHIVINQLMKVNNISKNDALNYIKESFNIWRERNKHNWTLDISFIDSYI